MSLLKALFVFIAVSLYGYGCAVCKTQVPDVDVLVSQTHTDKQIQLDITWRFKKYFSAETILGYDKDRDGNLSKSELQDITGSFTEYLEQDSYLTFIKYVSSVETYDEADYLDFKIHNATTHFEDDQMYFEYTLLLPVAPVNGYELYLTFFDKQNFFRFKVHKVKLQNSNENNSTYIANASTSFIPFGDTHKVDTAPNTLEIFHDDTATVEQNATGFLGVLEQQMKKTKEKIFSLVEEIEMEGSIMAYFWLLGFSLIYGIIHALGPGHGKSLVAAYFLGNNRSTIKAFSIATLIGVVHTFSAFLLTFAVYYVLNAYLNEYFTDLESVTIKISAVIIILIALYLLYKKLPKRKTQKPVWSVTNPGEHDTSCGCGACKSTSTDLGIILSAGIVPCPGTITIFVFSLSLGAYTVGFLSAVFMSIGMSIVIFVAALLSIKVRQQTSSNHTLRSILDYGSLLFIFMLGVILFFMA